MKVGVDIAFVNFRRVCNTPASAEGYASVCGGLASIQRGRRDNDVSVKIKVSHSALLP